ESPMYAVLRFTLHKDRSIPAPQYQTTTGPLTPQVNSGAFYGTTGLGPDLYIAAQEAIRAMIDHLTESYDLSREDAYVLSSLAVDLKISEIVDAGQYVVSAVLPLAIFRR
ncbi:MAG TPA: acetamidase/formamidase family protein, partial [Gaiellaceae bacterium]|nr:acetamidase/formamidase family protein [Gaiellaceae bacterium]